MIKTDNGDGWYNIMTFMREMLKIGDRAVLVVNSDLLYIGVVLVVYSRFNTKLLQLYQQLLILIATLTILRPASRMEVILTLRISKALTMTVTCER